MSKKENTRWGENGKDEVSRKKIFFYAILRHFGVLLKAVERPWNFCGQEVRDLICVSERLFGDEFGGIQN